MLQRLVIHRAVQDINVTPLPAAVQVIHYYLHWFNSFIAVIRSPCGWSSTFSCTGGLVLALLIQ